MLIIVSTSLHRINNQPSIWQCSCEVICLTKKNNVQILLEKLVPWNLEPIFSDHPGKRQKERLSPLPMDHGGRGDQERAGGVLEEGAITPFYPSMQVSP